MIRRPAGSTRTDTPLPYTTLLRSPLVASTSMSASSAAPSTRRTGAITLPGVCFRPDGYKLGPPACKGLGCPLAARSEEHTPELQSLMRVAYAVFCLNKKNRGHPHER